MANLRPISGASNPSAGLHNLVTGLTSQSPALSPLTDPGASAASIPDSTSPLSAQTLFHTPSRSILSSGAPTSSVSAKTAKASMSASAPPSSSHPLSTLAMPSSSSSARRPRPSPSRRSTTVVAERTLPVTTAEKEVDDPTLPVDGNTMTGHGGTLTPLELTRLFAVTSAAPSSPRSSLTRGLDKQAYTRASTETAGPLPHHLWTKGFLGGRHSDIIVRAFSNSYPLHRILLDRSPFFSSALSEPWFESTAKEIDLHPEDIDPNITQASFELALKRLYGSATPLEEEKEAIGLFATGSWLEMSDLVQSSLDYLLGGMRTSNIVDLIKLVTSNYYGQPGERLLSAAKAMLYREGWEMPSRHWDGIPAEMVRDVVGGDGFFVPGEWDRYRLGKKLFDRRLQNSAIAYGLLIVHGRTKNYSIVQSSAVQSSAVQSSAVQSSAVQSSAVQKKPGDTKGKGPSIPSRPTSMKSSSEADQWQILYGHPDVAPLVDLLEQGIHYVHLTFEQLQCIRGEKDMFGRPLVSDETVTNALWMSMELRGKIVNAQEADAELGLQMSLPQARETATSRPGAAEEMRKTDSADSASSSAGGKDAWYEAGTPDDEGPRKFWIPSVDSTKVVGDESDIFSGRFATSVPPAVPSQRAPKTPKGRSSAVTPPEASDSGCSSGRANGARQESPQAQQYSNYPPYRFSVEFPNPRLLKDKKRVYSRTVEYLGSHWNIYIQKIRSSKNVQLGVYLHRAKDREGEDRIRGAAPRSVDEAIGQLEREMLLRRTERRLRRQQQYEAQLEGEEESSSGGDNSILRGNTTSTLPFPGRNGMVLTTKASQTPALTLSTIPDHAYATARDGTSDEDDEAGIAPTGSVPALPRYVDGRPTIKTYFKLYSPTKGGLSVYESAPDGFNFSQSWGWRSSMILDDGSNSDSGDGASGGGRSRDGRLRFSVVLGNV
ncbi:MAG: hypothetical protein M1832_000178 [Thelocarpon impressellum]|nr:MAG: hypothetical protein M1832_000178 [Thelocarpon impressellum]